jgi:hypothetical protein
MIARAIKLGKYQDAIHHGGTEYTEESVLLLKAKAYKLQTIITTEAQRAQR